MPIKWSALKVSEAADMIEELINQAAEPLEQARLVAREARKINNLPQYVDQDFLRILGEIDRAIGGSRWEPIGRLRACIEAIRKDIPSGAIEAEQESLRHGSQQALIV
jgi:hypothetical protein